MNYRNKKNKNKINLIIIDQPFSNFITKNEQNKKFELN